MQYNNINSDRVTFRNQELRQYIRPDDETNEILGQNHQKTIYIVDDDMDDRFFCEMLLRQSAYVGDVKGFCNAVELFEYFKSIGIYHQSEIKDQDHLVLLDIHMPTINGIEVLDFIRTHPITSDIEVILLTSDTSPESIYEAHKLNATGYLQKPFSLKLFDEIIQDNTDLKI